MAINEGGWDRGLRMTAGLVLLWVAWAVASPVASWAILVIALVALVTGIVGWCPAYAALRISTRKVRG